MPVKSRRLYAYWKFRNIYLMILPGIVYYLTFHYLPMAGIVVAFKDYEPYLGIWKSDWVSFKHFQHFFDSYYFWPLIRNTVMINVLKFLFGLPAPIAFALLLNEVRNQVFKRVVQTFSYFPHFISWIVVIGIMVDLFSPSIGFVNKVIQWFGHEPIDFLMDKSYFYPMVVLSSVWKDFGWGSILYLAAISGIDPQLYEAATVDGAGRWRKMLHITFPSLIPVVVIIMILNIGNMLNADFMQILALVGDKAFLYDIGDVIDTYVYREGLLHAQYSFTAAVGIFKGIVGLMLVIMVNRLAKQFGQEGLW